MGLFSFGEKKSGEKGQKPLDLAEGVLRAQETAGAVLMDVRTREEYAAGHVPGSVNLPLDELEAIQYPKETPLFVYCRSGNRSGQAEKRLKKMGYQAENIGGVMHYSGDLVQ